MKTPTLTCLAAVTGILVAEPVPNQLPEVVPASNPDHLSPARLAVGSQIVSRLRPSLPPFSRAMPVPRLPIYREVEVVSGEKRLPFSVADPGRNPGVVSGYVRLSDNAIFIFRPEKKDHIRSTQDPRFASEKSTKFDPKKPA